jgi:hypothetical protein
MREVGAKDVTVTNLEPAACESLPEEDNIELEVTAPPEIEEVSPVPACSKQKTYEEFRVDGSGFVRIAPEGEQTRRPTVDIGGRSFEVQSMENCTEVNSVDRGGASRCETAYVRIPAGVLDEISQEGTDWEPLSSHDAGTVDGGTSDAGTSDTSDTSSSDTSTTDTGTTDATGDDTGSSDDAGTMDAGTEQDAGPQTPGPRPNTELTTLPMTLTNPQPAGCESAEAGLPVVPPPMVHDVTPDPSCNVDTSGEDEEPTTSSITVDGTGFLRIDTAPDSDDEGTMVPALEVEGETYEETTLSGCTEIPVPGRQVESCTQLSAEIDRGVVDNGAAEVAVRNPEPAECVSEGSAPVQLTPRPTVSSVDAEPICAVDQGRRVTLHGDDFHVVDGELPEVSIGMGDAGTVEGVANCRAVGTDDRSDDVRTCDTLHVGIAQGALSPGMIDGIVSRTILVENPGGNACGSPAEANLRVAEAPDLAGATEDFACLEDGARSFTIEAESQELLRMPGDGMNAEPDRVMVEVDGNVYAADSMSDCSSASPPQGAELCRTVSFTVPQEDLEVGTHAVSVHQPAPASCAGSETVELTVEPSPTVAAVSEQPVCGEQTNQFTATGEFWRIEDAQSGDVYRPSVQVGNAYKVGPAEVSLSNCSEATSVESRDLQRCTQLTFSADSGDLDPGRYTVSAVNPRADDPTADTSQTPPVQKGCASRDDTTLRVEPKPTLARKQPEPICTETSGGPTTVTAVGDDLLSIQDVLAGSTDRPTVTFSRNGLQVAQFEATGMRGCDARPIDGDNPRVKSCVNAEFTIGEGDLPATYDPSSRDPYEVSLENPDPAGCGATNTVEYTVMPAPRIESLEPDLTCVDDRQQSYTLTATADQPFLAIDDTTSGPVRTPEVEIDGRRFETSVDLQQNCQVLGVTPNRPDYTVYTCQEASFNLNEGALDAGQTYPVAVYNPAQSECRSSNTVDLRVEQAPVVQAVAPSPVCTAQNTYTNVSIEGENFLRVDGDLPDVQIGGLREPEVQEQNMPASSCTQTSKAGVEECTEIVARVERDALAQGQLTDNRVVVQNPAPADCESTEDVFQKDAPPPTLANAAVQQTCPSSSPNRMILESENDDKDYYEMGGRPPEVTIDDETYTSPDLIGSCDTLTNTSEATERCNVLSVELSGDQSDAEGNKQYNIGIVNPKKLQCSVSKAIQVGERPANRPKITDVQPPRTCSSGGILEIDGENFQKTPTVELGGVAADSITFVDSQNLTAEWDNTNFPNGGALDLTVTNPNGCQNDPQKDTWNQNIDVLTGPLAVYLDPAVHYREIALSGRLYFTNGDPSDVTQVQIRDPSGNVYDLDFDTITGEDDQLRVTLPENSSLPEGMYDVRVTEQLAGVNCGSWRDELLEVVGSTEIAMDGIEPKYGSTFDDTSVRITASSNPPGGKTQFKATPRVYLNPVTGQADRTATELTGVTFNSRTELNGIIEGSEFGIGEYQVVVINPDSTVGVLSPPDGFTVTEFRTPEIASVSPGTWDTPNNNLQATIEGNNFRIDPSATDPYPVTMQCRDGTAPSMAAGTITIDGDGNKTIDLTVDTDTMDKGDACVIRVNNREGTYSTYSPIATVNPSYKFISFEDGPLWKQARRWPAMDSGEPSRQQRFVYTLGGDNGAGTLGPSDVRASGEFAQIDRFGTPEEWQFLPYDLPGDGRTLARSTRIRDFIYLVGGYNGSTVTNDISRAHVLDPTHTPEITGLDFNFSPSSGGGLESGVYYYRVSAVHKSSSDHNPGGETLPSGFQPVYIPDLQNYDVTVDIEWSTFTNVDQYRVYRSPDPNVAAGQERLLGTTQEGTTSFTDDGTNTTSSDDYLAVGALGKWHSVGQLDRARARHGLQSVIDPNDPDTAYIYALGGRSTAAGTPVSSIEKITILGDEDTKRAQRVDSVTTSTRTLSEAREELDAMVATPGNSNNLSSGTVYLYSIGGEEPLAGGTTDTIEYWQVEGGTGNLKQRQTSTSMQRKRSGFAATIANDVALAFGGQNGAPDSNGDKSSRIETNGNLPSWSSLGGISMTARHRLGRVSFVGYLYIGGGVDSGGTVFDSMEYAVIGSTRR